MLPIVGQPSPERADAARNRRALLAAAQTILTERGIDALSMDRVAARAGVGVGTVYRRFGDRAGLALALLDDTELRFQAAFLSGPPPLGPGAPPVARIRAFLHAYVDRLETEAELHAFADTKSPTARHRSGAYRTARAHLVALLSMADPTADVNYLADALLAALGAGLFLHQRQELGFDAARVKAGLDHLLIAVTEPRCGSGLTL
ncbi:MAG: TetR family transcriptional regulator [Pseudonocardiaceae bacterium]|nr:TetR family transcriptional regulator [Pseudonocardiaceae bacterium]